MFYILRFPRMIPMCGNLEMSIFLKDFNMQSPHHFQEWFPNFISIISTKEPFVCLLIISAMYRYSHSWLLYHFLEEFPYVVSISFIWIFPIFDLAIGVFFFIIPWKFFLLFQKKESEILRPCWWLNVKSAE